MESLVLFQWLRNASFQQNTSIVTLHKHVSFSHFQSPTVLINHPQRKSKACMQLLSNSCVGGERAGIRARVSAWEDSKVSKYTDYSLLSYFLFLEASLSVAHQSGWMFSVDVFFTPPTLKLFRVTNVNLVQLCIVIC